MRESVALACFGAVLAGALGVGAAVGSAVGPLDVGGGAHGHDADRFIVDVARAAGDEHPPSDEADHIEGDHDAN